MKFVMSIIIGTRALQTLISGMHAPNDETTEKTMFSIQLLIDTYRVMILYLKNYFAMTISKCGSQLAVIWNHLDFQPVIDVYKCRFSSMVIIISRPELTE